MRGEVENFEPYNSSVALSSKKLSANRQTDGRKLQDMYMSCPVLYFVSTNALNFQFFVCQIRNEYGIIRMYFQGTRTRRRQDTTFRQYYTY